MIVKMSFDKFSTLTADQISAYQKQGVEIEIVEAQEKTQEKPVIRERFRLTRSDEKRNGVRSGWLTLYVHDLETNKHKGTINLGPEMLAYLILHSEDLGDWLTSLRTANNQTFLKECLTAAKAYSAQKEREKGTTRTASVSSIDLLAVGIPKA